VVHVADSPQLFLGFTNHGLPQGKKIVIIFASSDKDQHSFEEYFKEMPWLAFPFGDARIAKLNTEFGVNGIPWLVILDSQGKLLENEADGTVGSKGEAAIDNWLALC